MKAPLLKNMFDIRRDFGATETRCSGPKGGNVFTCVATLPDGEKITGYGSTMEIAEDTAWHGVKIHLASLHR